MSFDDIPMLCISCNPDLFQVYDLKLHYKTVKNKHPTGKNSEK
ncbi:hypothetical protein JCM19237_1400 [Photobacterium aphoticum]|uniref:C2H2-type domain-containing protein n=1 Tax=Photobacterium aphoticum TaxID=754436 RepID=A0A090QWB2_9GAMM|nr:hypothetical protein JCM19237_1400 [Photobacterium aphoticum]